MGLPQRWEAWDPEPTQAGAWDRVLQEAWHWAQPPAAAACERICTCEFMHALFKLDGHMRVNVIF